MAKTTRRITQIKNLSLFADTLHKTTNKKSAQCHFLIRLIYIITGKLNRRIFKWLQIIYPDHLIKNSPSNNLLTINSIKLVQLNFQYHEDHIINYAIIEHYIIFTEQISVFNH